MSIPQQTDAPRPPTVGVLLCNYNDARFLPDSLGAILAQTRPPDEIIVVDDGSTDDSIAIIEAHLARHPKGRLIRNEVNRGLLYSIQRAIDAAESDYVVWAAADDMLLPDFIRRNAEELTRHPGAALSFSRLATFPDGSDEIVEYSEKQFGDAFDLGKEPNYLTPSAFFDRLKRSYLWMSGNTVVVRRDLLKAAGGFDAKLRWHADWFTLYAIGLRHGVCVLPETLAKMRTRVGTFSGEGMQRKREQAEVLSHLLRLLTARSNRDLYWIAVQRPSVLSVFGKQLLFASFRNPAAWLLSLTYGAWLTNHWLHCQPWASRMIARAPRFSWRRRSSVI